VDHWKVVLKGGICGGLLCVYRRHFAAGGKFFPGTKKNRKNLRKGRIPLEEGDMKPFPRNLQKPTSCKLSDRLTSGKEAEKKDLPRKKRKNCSYLGGEDATRLKKGMYVGGKKGICDQ